MLGRHGSSGSPRPIASTVFSRGSGWRRVLGFQLVLLLGQMAVSPPLVGAGSDPGLPRERVWIGPDGAPLPFADDGEILEFLRTAEIVSRKRVGEGVTNPWKVLLEKDGIQMHAVFRDVRVQKDRKDPKTGLRFRFRDDARFEVAAYKLSQMLGLDNVPPAVERRVMGKRGSLQIWVEEAISEKTRQRGEIEPGDGQKWRLQTQIMRVFDNLIFNHDRNQGNILYDSDWKLWMIDHTRAFHRDKRLPFAQTVWFCERTLFENLQSLDAELVRQELKPYLYPAEIKGLLVRRDLLVARIEELIETRGRHIVLFDLNEILNQQRADLSASGDSATAAPSRLQPRLD